MTEPVPQQFLQLRPPEAESGAREFEVTTENEFIRTLARRFPVRPPVEVGIGDDGAVLYDPDSLRTIIVTDMLLDGVHFDLNRTSPRLAGRKAVAVNLSDLAAMACRPTAALVSLAVPRSLRCAAFEFLDELYDGIEELTEHYKFTLAGGDTNSWDGPLAINVCLTGVPFGSQPVLRSGAQSGDVLFVTGPLGGSLHHDRHLLFSPRLEIAEWLIRHVPISAMMDISDGLSMDLHRLTEASRCSAVLDAGRIPIHGDVPLSLPHVKRLEAALGDGEDFELLFSVNRMVAVTLQEEAARAGIVLYQIGVVESGTGCRIRDSHGNESPMQISGWQHALS